MAPTLALSDTNVIILGVIAAIGPTLAGWAAWRSSKKGRQETAEVAKQVAPSNGGPTLAQTIEAIYSEIGKMQDEVSTVKGAILGHRADASLHNASLRKRKR